MDRFQPSEPIGRSRPLESCALGLLADDEVQEAVSHVKARCHSMLHCCGAGYYQKRYAVAHQVLHSNSDIGHKTVTGLRATGNLRRPVSFS